MSTIETLLEEAQALPTSDQVELVKLLIQQVRNQSPTNRESEPPVLARRSTKMADEFNLDISLFVDVDKLVQEANMLPREELRQLIEKLLVAEGSKKVMSEEEFQAHLVREGIISQLPGPLDERASAVDFKPIEVKGKPVSETIIEERR